MKAEEAKRITAKYYEDAEVELKHWVSCKINDALSAVKDASSMGNSEVDFEAFTVSNTDKYKLARSKLLHVALLRLGFKVGVYEKKSDTPLLKKQVVMKINWS